MFRKIRIAVLLLILFVVATTTWLTQLRSTDWKRTQWLVVYPINGDGSPRTGDYLATINRDTFAAIEQFMGDEAEHYGIALDTPIEVHLAPAVTSLPPPPPVERKRLAVALWSLQLRWWAWRNDTFKGPGSMQMFVVYHDPEQNNRLEHSLGLQKGMVGVVHAFADDRMAEQNNVVIAHELLHLFGASDKYDLATNQPIYPQGYAEPDRQPLYPQEFAEIMGGRIPVSDERAEMPRHLLGVVVGEQTAREIRWLRD